MLFQSFDFFGTELLRTCLIQKIQRPYQNFRRKSCNNGGENTQEYCRRVIEDGDSDKIIRALGYIAKAHGRCHTHKK